jgi:hypothetical protein
MLKDRFNNLSCVSSQGIATQNYTNLSVMHLTLKRILEKRFVNGNVQF